MIGSWIKVAGDTVSIDQEAAKAYVENLATNYNTIYVPRTLHTSYGSDVTISNNEYGFQIDQSAELVQLLADIGSGSPVTRDPVYSISGMKRNGKTTLPAVILKSALTASTSGCIKTAL